jgi:hypothetical protein
MRRTPLLTGIATLALLGAACDEPGGSAAGTPAAATAERPSGKEGVQRLGDPLTRAPRVSVDDLFARPQQYKGQRVRVEGVVKDFCHHQRAWFGVTSRSGERMLRVFARPRFAAPADCKGKRVVAEGVVDVHTIPAEEVAHYAKAHHFLTEEEIRSGGPVHRPMLRAAGAEFF